MTAFGTPLAANAIRVLFLGSGELGKEVVIELQRLGVEVIACDRYANAPAMQVAHRSHVFPMLDGAKLRAVVEQEQPHYIVPEIEAIHTPTLLELEAEGWNVIPTARAARLTMDREGIRRLAAETLGLPTSPYRFADSFEQFEAAVAAVGIPCVVKPLMSSSGKGQSVVKTVADVRKAWDYAQQGGRAGAGRVIAEGFIDFDYEITLLTIRHSDGRGGTVTSFCAPIGHLQIDGDYRESWQPHPMSAAALRRAEQIAEAVVNDLCAQAPESSQGRVGVFGVELFVKGDEVIFSEVSPRPHDTGLVTLISQDLSQFALHARAILGLPIPNIRQRGAAASCALLCEGDQVAPSFTGLEQALAEPDTMLRLFGKPEIVGKRRMGVALALDADIDAARAKARRAAAAVRRGR
jgi:phosphoribosylglycinamide formyltransferase 2